jgi:hypothetical protein
MQHEEQNIEMLVGGRPGRGAGLSVPIGVIHCGKIGRGDRQGCVLQSMDADRYPGSSGKRFGRNSS